jgi:hypothetical protein
MPPRAIVVPCALLIAAAAPAAAPGATLAPLKPCYVTAGGKSEGVDLRASGFTPNAKVDLAIDGQPVVGAQGLQADGAGALGAIGAPPQAAAPFVRTGSRPFSLTLTEHGNPANVATGTSRVVALGVSVKPRRARPSRRIRFRGAGFTDPKGVYAHYLYGGKVRATVRLARNPGRCGRWQTRAPQIPLRDPAIGLWTVQFDQSRRYLDPSSGRLKFHVRLGISVTRTFSRP